MRLRALITVLCGLFNSCSKSPPMSAGKDQVRPYQVDYDQMISLDAEALAEEGIQEAYLEIVPKLRENGIEPDSIEEMADHEAPSYSVKHRGVVYPVYDAGLGESEDQSWGRATYILFHIVNLQLDKSEKKFYAFYGGNDLGGMFLSRAEFDAARRELPKKIDWPYLPTLKDEWYGQPH